MPVAPLSKHFVDDELSQAPALIEQVCVEAAAQSAAGGSGDGIAHAEMQVRHQLSSARLHADGLALLEAPGSPVRRAVDALLASLASGR